MTEPDHTQRPPSLALLRILAGTITCMLVALVFAPAYAGDPPALIDPAFRASIRDDYQTPPRGMTAEEKATYVAPDLTGALRAPPPVSPRAQSEYEPNDGLLIRWGSQNALLADLTVAATTLDATARMFIVVRDEAQRVSAASTLQTAGANMERVEFIIQPCSSGCSVWMRDYGPRFVDLRGMRASIDHTYNRPRPVDNAFPDVWSALKSEPQYDIPLLHGGGNFHLFSNRRAFMTALIQTENAGTSTQQIRDLYRDYQGLDVEIVPAFPTSFDSTQHIDMWVYPVDDDEIIVSEYPEEPGNSLPRQIADNFAAARAAEGYTVYRTPGWHSGNTHFTYANSIALNSIVLVCSFQGQGAKNEQARAVYATAFQDKRIVQVDCSNIIGLAGAIHCIVMHVPDGRISLLFKHDFE